MPTATFKNLIQYTTLAATATKDIANLAEAPFLASIGALTLAILKSVQSVRSDKEECAQMVEQIHEVLCVIVRLYATSEIEGVLPTAVLYDIAKFAETLQKIYTFLKARQGMGKIKQFFKPSDNGASLDMCKQELNHTLEMFKVRSGGSTMSQMVQMRKEAKQQHEELLALLAAHPDLTNSERSSVTGTLSSLGSSSGSFSMLPSHPHIFHGRDSELQKVVNILIHESPRIAILGAGGMGKTSLATAALHHPDVVAKYPTRYFVPCESAPTCAELVVAIANYVGVPKGSGLLKKVVLHLTQAPPSLLVLDNFETPWEAGISRPEVEEFLSLLADIGHLGLIVTMRGAERPAKVKWTRPFLAPLEPLTDLAALQTFLDVADTVEEEQIVHQLLNLTGNLPLAVSLIANVAAYEGCSQALSRWQSESTQMLSDGYDKRSSLDISILLSFTGSRMTTEAQDLLSILSMLPNGLSDGDLVQANLPIANILECKTTLLRTALAFLDKNHHIRVLLPIREHILTIHPPSTKMKLALRKHFHDILDLWNNFRMLNPVDIVPQISRNLGNLNSVLVDALSTGTDAMQSIESILFLNSFYRNTQDASSPLLQNLSEKMPAWQDQPIFGDYLIERFHSVGYLPMVDAEDQIRLGNKYFQSMPPLKEAEWTLALGTYHEYGNTDLVSAIKCYQRALSLSDSSGDLQLGHRILCDIANAMIVEGNPLGAQEHAQKAQEYAERLGDIRTQIVSLRLQMICQTIFFANYQFGQSLGENARNLLISCGLQGTHLDDSVSNVEAEIHLLKTQYLESRAIQAVIAANQYPGSYHAVGALMNIALIDIATGVDSDLIKKNVETCRLQVQALHGLQQKHIGLMVVQALGELYLRDGNLIEANRTLVECATTTLWTEQKLLCLDNLADLSSGMNDVQGTQRWAGMFLALALKSKNKLATMQAFRCLGQIFVAEGDDESALSVFNIALDGFTFMDVHRWRADCMVRIADVLERRGDVGKSVELWKKAKPLFERSSQALKVAEIEAKFASVDAEILVQQEEQGRELAELNAPVGNIEEDIGEVSEQIDVVSLED